MERKVIQLINATPPQLYDHTRPRAILHAVCDDGTLWTYFDVVNEWKPFQTVPQTIFPYQQEETQEPDESAP